MRKTTITFQFILVGEGISIEIEFERCSIEIINWDFYGKAQAEQTYIIDN